MIDIKKLGLFAGGVLFGTAGIAILSSKDAKNAYTHCTAAVLRGKDSVMKTAATVKENCGDIYEKAAEEKVEAARALVEEYEQKAEEEA